MLCKDIFNIINEYLYNIKIINEHRFLYKCSQCRSFHDYWNLKETNEQSWEGSPRIYCKTCRIMFKPTYMFTYKPFK